MKERECKIMQINIRIFQEDDNNEILKDFMCMIINTANDNGIAVESITLEEKELFSMKNSIAI